MSDAERRRKQRAARSGGSVEGMDRVEARHERQVNEEGGPYAHLVGKDNVLLAGAAWNVYGTLIRRERTGGGYRLIMGPAWDGDYDVQTFSRAMKIGTPEVPAVIHEDHMSYAAARTLTVNERSAES